MSQTRSATTESTNVSGNKSSSKTRSTTRKPVAVRSTRTTNTDESKTNHLSSSISTSSRTKPEGNKRVHTAPTSYPSTAEKTVPRRQRTTDFPLTITESHSSDSQAFLTPIDSHPRPILHFQTQNPRESIASTEPSSYYSAEDSFNASFNDEDIPPLPNPHPLLTTAPGSKHTISYATQTPSASASEQTVIPTQDSGLGYRTSTRTTASTSTRTTGRSASTGASVIEPSRQSTSDSEAYTRGNTTGPGSKHNALEEAEEDLATLVAGLEELVEEPEFDDEDRSWDAIKGKMKMPEAQHYSTRLSTTQEEDEDIYEKDDEGEQAMPMPMPISESFTHSRDQSSSTAHTLTTSRPFVIPPTPKSPPPVPSSSRGEKQATTGTNIFADAKPQHDQVGSHPPRGTVGTAPLNVRRVKMPSSASAAAGGEGTASGTEKDNASPLQYGTAMITGMSSSRIERPDRPGSGGVGVRTSTTSTSISGTASGRAKTDSTSHHRPSIDAHTYTHGRTMSTASASGVSRPTEMRISGGGPLRPPPPPKERIQDLPGSAPASAALGAATMAGRSRLPPGVSAQMDTQYVNMLLALDDIPAIHNLAAAFFNWIYLAGFVLFPGTFTSLKNLEAQQGSDVAAQLINSVTQLPL